MKAWLVGVALVVGLVATSVVVRIITAVSSDSKVEKPRPTAAVNKTGSNEANDKLVALPAKQRATLLGAGITDGCHGDKTFFRGRDPETGIAFWTVHCTDGNSYQITIEPGDVRESRFVDCLVISKIAHDNCYRRIRGTVQ